MFDIPMKSSGAIGLSQLDSSNFAKNTQQNVNNQTPQTNFSSPQPMQQPAQQNFGAPQPVQQEFGAPQNNFSAPQPMQQPAQQNFGASQPVQQGFGTPQATQPNFGAPQTMQQPVQPKQRPAGNGVILKKGQKTSLSKMNPNLDLIEVGLGWDLGPNGQGYDLDVEAFLLGANGKVIGDDWFVFYNQPSSPDGSVRLIADSTTGAGAGDDEIIQVRLSQVNNSIAKIVFIVTINDAKENGYNFSNVTNAYVRIVDKSTGKELIRFNLTEYYNTVCSMMVGEVYKHNNEWKFSPIGDGTGDDLEGLCIRYGVNIAG